MKPTAGKGPAATNLDNELLSGCFTTTGICFVLLGVGIWPHIAWGAVFAWSELGRAALLGLLPCVVLGVVAVRKFRYPGVTGFVGASAGVALFWYLRLGQIGWTAMAEDMPQAEYPATFTWLVPVAYMVLATAVAMIAFSSGDDSP